MKIKRTASQLLAGLIALALLALSACSQSAPSPTAVPQDTRAIYRAGLIKEQQKTLDQLPGASVYTLDVQIAADYGSLQGREQVLYTNREDQALEAVYFQLFPNMAGGKSRVSAVKADGNVCEPVYEADFSAMHVPLPALLQPGQSVRIQMDFTVDIPKTAGGNYGLFGYLDNVLVLDGFYPAIPVYDAKGWHAGKTPPNGDTTFQDASFYVVHVTVPAALTIVGSGYQVEQTQKEQTRIATFAAGPARDFYMAASEYFAVTSARLGETQVNSYAFKENAEGSRLALDTAVNALKSFSARFGAYPYTEFDLVSTPMQGALGIEYPGMTGISMALYDPGADVRGQPAPAVLEGTVAHEVGHQWFYNLVGNDQANEPWLDESVVQYMTGLYYLDQYGQQGFDGYRASWVSRWERVNKQPVPIGLPAGSYTSLEYGAIVYGRGPLFIEALAKKMGQAVFDRFLRGYVQENAWGIGTAASFKRSAEKECQCDLTPIFNEWVSPQPAPTPTPAP